MINVTLTPDCSQVIITVTDSVATATNEILVSDASGSNTYQYSFPGGTSPNTRVVFLLLDSALSTVELTNTTQGQFNSGYYLDIAEKYKKAKSICDNSCGCDC